MPKNFSWREIALLCLPFFVIAFGARWAQQRPRQAGSTPAPPLQLRVVKMEKLPVTAYDVARGADTKVRIEVVATAAKDFVIPISWDWQGYAFVAATKNGKTSAVQDQDSRFRIAPRFTRQTVFRGGEGEAHLPSRSRPNATYEMTVLLRLKDVPVKQGALELSYDVAFGPNLFSLMPMGTSAQKMALYKKSPQILSLNASLPLRPDGAKIARVVASTDPLFDVQRVDFTPIHSANDDDVRINLHIFHRGPAPKNFKAFSKAKFTCGVTTANGKNVRGMVGYIWAEKTNAARCYTMHSTIDTRDALRRYPNGKKLFWRAYISLNDAWPREIIVPIDLPVSFKSSQTKR